MKKKIALVTGGYSGESVISYKSAEAMYKSLDREKWDCYWIDIKPSGWFYRADDGTESAVDKNDFSILVDGKKMGFDAALIGLHGTPGEDGKLQGYFDCIGLPYTSCDAATSALTFNKRYTVAVAAFAGMPVAKSMHLFAGDKIGEKEIMAELTLPVFVKPNNGGSSIGMSKVTESKDLDSALQKAFKEDQQVLVEEFIKGREFTIGVFSAKNEIIALPITEIKTNHAFFDFEAKYEGASEEITPAQVEETIAEKIRSSARKIYALFNCRGIIRIDFIYDETRQEPVMLEINTVPGQTSASLVPQQVRAMGWTMTQFYSSLIESCLER